ncbi:protein SLC31A2 isoform X3 [Eurosta solidaginis]|uniref:protein SLC31A2 isoform X3 n=1 Tax=Eurosta solidaginis TaxID=178769 RepID=UPI003530993F
MVPILFHGGHCERILWKSWTTNTYNGFIFSCLVLIIMGFLYEALKFLRQHMIKQATRKAEDRINLELEFMKKNDDSISASMSCSSKIALTNIGMTSKITRQYIAGKTHIISTLLFFLQIVISYLLMLVIMNLNYWLFLSAIIGLGLGYFIFGLNQLGAFDSDCCH